jgi:hypothetical protein
MFLYNMLNYAKAEDDLPRRDALLGELRALAVSHPDDAFVQEVWRPVALSHREALIVSRRSLISSRPRGR